MTRFLSRWFAIEPQKAAEKIVHVLSDLLGRTWSAPLDNGLTAGVLVAILMTAFIELTSPRKRRLE
ncbi:MAG: hypothetical protein F4187_01640, partial [Gemmatimonadetes bacterium]|nr:hypothetical protein [Gemmatimonadota bacterium]